MYGSELTQVIAAYRYECCVLQRAHQSMRPVPAVGLQRCMQGGCHLQLPWLWLFPILSQRLSHAVSAVSVVCRAIAVPQNPSKQHMCSDHKRQRTNPPLLPLLLLLAGAVCVQGRWVASMCVCWAGAKQRWQDCCGLVGGCVERPGGNGEVYCWP